MRGKKVLGHFHLFFKKNSPIQKDIKFCPAPLDAPRRELFICIFKSIVALSVSRQIDFLYVCTGRTIQLYCERLIEVCQSGRHIEGYGQFNSSDKDPNPIFDPTLALNKVPNAPGGCACNRDSNPVAFSIQLDGNGCDNIGEWVGYICDDDTNWYEPEGYPEEELTGLETTSSRGV